jgi:8-oxoguanine deaminase
LEATAVTTLLVKNIKILVTVDDSAREITNAGMFVRDGFIERIGKMRDMPNDADEVVDLSGHIVLPGLINTHHHLSQTLDRAFGPAQNGNLINWLSQLYPRWDAFEPEDTVLATQLGLAEIALSGCTTVGDHHYLWPTGVTAEEQFQAAQTIGVRFHLGRGYQNFGKPHGGFASEKFLEEDDAILSEISELIAKHHNASPGSFKQVFVAPSSLRSVTPDLMRRSAELAAKTGTKLHFHLGETKAEIDFTLTKYGKRPAEVAHDLGCLTAHTWLAHGVHFNESDVALLHRCGCGVCHCPSSNMRLSSGIAPVSRYRNSGLTVGLGVDGSASNDSSNLLAEMRLALLLSRVTANHETDFLTARTVIEMATRGSASLLGRKELGVLAPGYAADFVAINTDRIEIVGSQDPVAAIVFCALTRVDHSWVHGRRLVKNGQLVGFDLDALIERIRSTAARRDGPFSQPAGAQSH